MIPSHEETLELIRQYRVPQHIIRHSMMVRRVALAIATSLSRAGFCINHAAVDRASLLHDLCKMDSIRSGNDHAHMAREVLRGLGYHTIGEIVGQHVRLKTRDINEAMVVNYADKRVMHDRVVSLSQRFDDLMNRYGTDEARRERIFKHRQDIIEVEEILGRYCGDLDSLDALNLIPCDQPLDCG
jgi:putative nucleotidyltransferase with HDIG domain